MAEIKSKHVTLIPPLAHFKGFTLPTSNTTANGSFFNLITQTSANANTIVQAPLMFVRGGWVNPGNRLYSAGVAGYHISSVSESRSTIYNLLFYNGSIEPISTNDRWSGQSIRCVALGG